MMVVLWFLLLKNWYTQYGEGCIFIKYKYIIQCYRDIIEKCIICIYIMYIYNLNKQFIFLYLKEYRLIYGMLK